MITSVAQLTDQENPEPGGHAALASRSRAAIRLPVFVVTMLDMVSSGAVTHRLGMGPVNWIELLALATPVVWYCGWPFSSGCGYPSSIAAPTCLTLIGLGVGAA